MDNTLRIEDKVVTKMDVLSDVSLVTFSGEGNALLEIQDILRRLNQGDIAIDMVMKQFYEGQKWTFSCSFFEKDMKKLEESKLLDVMKSHDVDITIREKGVQITLVGVGMATVSGVLANVFGQLEKENIPFYGISTSEISISFLIQAEYKMKAVVVLSSFFGL